ncbi:phospholipase D-like domain-containing protein [Flavobacterium plurextorum]|uniref:phospholipase D-like domain-containing protein n=1 Tax=Flavobacterium TaxID=237 RepID=UPI00214DBA96|nr:MULTISPECIES: phospholipase D-like domain-containing protein [Flavobacterium]UUW08301.1 phospholipase D-like domain-containing protein [Flavobacterium plurextorum]
MELFTTNIEQVLMERFGGAEKSIYIVVAWFTNPKIIYKLIELKKSKNLDIQILTDDNHINDKYFYQLYGKEILDVGIELKKQHFKKFNHNKFAVLDNETIIMGSYNYTGNAKKNLENIIVEKNRKAADYYYRNFRFFTDVAYVDPVLEILFEDFDFANRLISMYFPFSAGLFKKIKRKLHLGYCFTHENGLYNEISYDAGLIFNPKWKLHKELKMAVGRDIIREYSISDLHSKLSQEFELPVSKELIVNFKINKSNDFNYQIVRETAQFESSGVDYEALAELFEGNQKAYIAYYTQKFQTICSLSEYCKK